MSRKLNQSSTGSLDLLLDTICNMFGSIILIAILVVIISAEIPENSPTSASSQDKDSVERQIATAEQSRQTLEEQLAKIHVTETSREAAVLREKLKAAQNVLDVASKDAASNSANEYVDYSGSIAAHNEENRALKAKSIALENELKSLEARERSLSEQTAAVATEIEKMHALRTESVRLPKERSTNRSPANIVFLYNEIFWLAPNGEPNTAGIEFTEIKKGIKIIPLRGKGWRLPRDSSANLSAIKEANQSDFLSCYVFPDSVDIFRAFRKIAYEQGAEIGWAIKTDISRLIFVSDGNSPSPQ